MTKDNLFNNWRFWIIILVVGFYVFLGIRGCVTRSIALSENKGKTIINVISSTCNVSQIRIVDTSLVGHDTIFKGSENVYQNRTGRDLVRYMVKYTTSGIDNGKPIGIIIGNNEYFFWYGDDNSYHMFESPPPSTTIVLRGRSGMRDKIDFTYLHFLDFKENVPKNVRIPCSP